MKHKLILSMLGLVFGIVSVSAQTNERITVSTGNFKHLEFGENLKVVLVQSASPSSQIGMNSEAVENLNIVLSGETLKIESRKPFSDIKTVYVEVNAPDKITLGEMTQITTEGIINSQNLNVYIYDGARAHLKTFGTVKAFPLGEEKVMIKRGIFRPSDILSF